MFRTKECLCYLTKVKHFTEVDENIVRRVVQNVRYLCNQIF